jgi:periplasmic protein CpxP/Spy
MIKNLVLTLALAGLVYCVTPSIAQDNTGPAQETAPPSGAPEHGHGNFDPARRADMLAKHLQLSSDQQAKVLDILKSAQSQMESMRSDASTPREEKRSKVMEIRKTANEQIRALLDSDQQKKFDQMQSRRQERQGHHGNGQPQGSPDSSEQK